MVPTLPIHLFGTVHPRNWISYARDWTERVEKCFRYSASHNYYYHAESQPKKIKNTLRSNNESSTILVITAPHSSQNSATHSHFLETAKRNITRMNFSESSK
mmetsp:Transcript_117147/g.239665  ORF Transcript_117147/g.239665 Transcript_117147/m.239665 type:complete len:102 (+) Transcript_117147:236-541(+)